MNQEILSYLKELAANNNRPWFQENKPRYEVLRQAFIDEVQRPLRFGDCRTGGQKLPLPHLSRHPLLAGQDALQAALLRLYRAGRTVERMGRLLFPSRTGELPLGGRHLVSVAQAVEAVEAGYLRPYRRVCGDYRESGLQGDLPDVGRRDAEADAGGLPDGFPIRGGLAT